MDVSAWLQSLGLGQYAQAFVDNAVDADVLPKLTADDLKEMGVTAVGHRRKLLDAIAGLEKTPQAPTPAAAPTSSAERRHLTVMFVDLVDSTRLSGRLDPEDMRNLVLAYQRAVAEEIRRVDGNVAKYMGDGVLAYFGWPQAHENEAERAVRAGLAIARAVSAMHDPHGNALSARVGISSGLVVVGDLIGTGSAQEETVVGDTPNLAARLQSFAKPGQVVISNATCDLLQGMFEVEDLGTPQLKGIEQAQHAFAVIAERSLESRFAARAARGLTSLVGRESELQQLRAKWKAAQPGASELVLVMGEPGVGKSRLVEALVDEVRNSPHHIVRMQCAPHLSGSPLFPVLSQIELALNAGEPSPQRLLRLKELSPALSGEDIDLVACALGLQRIDATPLAGFSAQQLRYRTLNALARHIASQANGRPTLLVFEDAHWADPSSLDWLATCLEAFPDGLMLLLTARPGFSSSLLAHPNSTTLVLGRLGRQDIVALARQVCKDTTVADVLIEDVIAKSDGVPLYVEEMIKAATSGKQKQTLVPATLQDSLMSRLDRLPTGKETAQIASVIGRSFDYATLSSVSPLRGGALEKDLEALSSEELIFRKGLVPDASYLFKHALVRDAAYESLLKARRQSIHANLLTALEARPGTSSDVLAFHAESANLPDKAQDYWCRAGDAAMARPAYHEAIGHYARAAAIAARRSEAREAELEIRTRQGLASIAARGHSHPETRAIFETALALTGGVKRPDLTFVTWYGLWCGHHVSGEIERARISSRELFAAGEVVGTSSHRMMGTRALAITALMSGDCSESLRHHTRALEFRNLERDRDFVRVTGQDQSVSFNSYYAINLWLSGDEATGLAHARQSIELARQVGHVNSLGYGYMHASLLLVLADDESRHAMVADMLGFVREHRLELWWDYARQFDALLKLQGGDRSALAALNGARASLRDRNARLFSATLALEAARHLLELGDDDLARAMVADASATIHDTHEGISEPELLRLQARLATRASRPDEARTQAQAAIRLAERAGAVTWKRRAAADLEKLA
jgi:class 3 adenylate cyclase